MLVVDEAFQIVSACEAREYLVLVFVDPSNDVVCYTNIENTVLPVGQDIDVEVTHGKRGEREMKRHPDADEVEGRI